MTQELFNIVVGVAGALWGWWITDDILTSKHEAQIQRIRADAATALPSTPQPATNGLSR